MVNLERIAELWGHFRDSKHCFAAPGAYKDTRGRLTGDLGGHAVAMYGVADGFGLHWFETSEGMALDSVYKRRAGSASIDVAAKEILGLPSFDILQLQTRGEVMKALANLIRESQQ